MRQLVLILLGVVLASTVVYAAGYSMDRGKPAAADAVTADVSGPSALQLKIVGDGLQLTWTRSMQDPGPVTGYEIVRADVYSGPFEPVGIVEPGVTTFVDRTAKPEIIYFYKLRALAGSRQSPFSTEAAGEITGKP